MKRFLYVLLATVGVVVLSCVSSLGYNYYVNKADSGLTTEDTTVGVQIEDAVTQVINPTFMSVDDVSQFYRQKIEQDSIDAVFMSIPYDILINVSRVVIGREGEANKTSIVKEFLEHNGSIYQYLKPSELESQASNKNDDTIKLPPNTEADTIINGKKFQLIKEKSSNE